MFAIAAFALGGMAFAPVFADGGSMSEDITMVSGNNNIAYDSFGCGSGDDCTMRSAAIAGFNQDQWTVWFGPTDIAIENLNFMSDPFKSDEQRKSLAEDIKKRLDTFERLK